MKKQIGKTDMGVNMDNIIGRVTSSIMMSFLGVNKMNKLIKHEKFDNVVELAEIMLNKLNVNAECDDDSLNNIPSKGAFVAVANFPHGLIDIFVLAIKIIKKRPDTRFLINPGMIVIPIIENFAVNKPDENEQNINYIATAIQHLKNDKPIIIFPAINPAHKNQNGVVTDMKWKNQIIKFAQILDVPILTTFISGEASKIFLKTTKVFPNANQIFYIKELFAHKNSVIKVFIAPILKPQDLLKLENKTYELKYEATQIIANTIRGYNYMQSLKLYDAYNMIKLNDAPVKIKEATHGKFKTMLIADNKYVATYFKDTIIVSDNSNNKILAFKIRVSSNISDFQHQIGYQLDLIDNVSSSTSSQNSIMEIHSIISPNYVSSKIELIIFLENMIKHLCETEGVKSVIINTTIEGTSVNQSTLSLFGHFLTERYLFKFSNAINRVNNEYLSISKLLREEVLQFPSVKLFLFASEHIEPIIISPMVVALLSIGAEVLTISKLENDKINSLIYLQV